MRANDSLSIWSVRRHSALRLYVSTLNPGGGTSKTRLRGAREVEQTTSMTSAFGDGSAGITLMEPGTSYIASVSQTKANVVERTYKGKPLTSIVSSRNYSLFETKTHTTKELGDRPMGRFAPGRRLHVGVDYTWCIFDPLQASVQSTTEST